MYNRLNYMLFEEFKRLDKLCGDLYQEQHGISRYIDDMKNTSINSYRHIPYWEADLKQLIRLRHIRNHLAHEENAFDEELCTQNDIRWIQEFYERILNETDPLALLYQYYRARSQAARPKPSFSQFPSSQTTASYNNHTFNEKPQKMVRKKAPKKKRASWITLLFIVIEILLVIAFLLIAVKLIMEMPR